MAAERFFSRLKEKLVCFLAFLVICFVIEDIFEIDDVIKRKFQDL